MSEKPVGEFNEDQRRKVTELAFEALETIDQLEGEHVIGDAVLLVEYMTPSDDGGSLTYVAPFFTTTRVVVRRGIIEQARDELATFAEEV